MVETRRFVFDYLCLRKHFVHKAVDAVLNTVCGCLCHGKHFVHTVCGCCRVPGILKHCVHKAVDVLSSCALESILYTASVDVVFLGF